MNKVLVIIAVLCPFFIPSTTLACSCGTGRPPFEFNRAKVVFVGRMLGAGQSHD